MIFSLFINYTGTAVRIFIYTLICGLLITVSPGICRANSPAPTPNPIPPLDRELEKQVFIETKMIEVNFEDKFDLGVSWSYVQTDQPNSSGFNITDSYTDLSILQTPEDSDIPIGLDTTTRVVNLARGDLTVNVQTLLTSGNTKLLSNPSITTIEGREAEIVTGRKVPYLTRQVGG